MHNDFTLFWRVVPSGKKVVYYYAYDENGLRRGPWTTGLTSMTLARNHCNKLLKDGTLLPYKMGGQTFAEYAEGWWEWDTCKHLKKRRKRHNITQAYADNNKKMLKNRLLPYFGNMPMNKITPEEIENWLDAMAEEGYQNTYTNTILGRLKTMMIEAVARKLIASNPAANMEKLVNDRKNIKIITREEFKALFVKDWKRVWDNGRIFYTANKLAALTGMRSSEVLGLRGEYVFDDHIYLCKQYDEYGYRDTKTKDKHNIPLTGDMINDLKKLKAMNGEGFLFSLDGGSEPICRRTMYDDFHRALNRIGIDDEEIADRHLHLHAWRHFCNTELQKAGISIPKVQSVTGHKSDRMTEWYCHFDPNEFGEIRKAQDALLQPEPENKPAKVNKQIKPELAKRIRASRESTVLSFPETGQTRRKRA